MKAGVTRGLDAGDDATMVVEIWTVLLVIFLLLFVLVAGARIERVRDTPPPNAANELQAVVEGSPVLHARTAASWPLYRPPSG